MFPHPIDPSPELRVAHVCIELAHGGLERCVVEWTRQRNRTTPGATRIVCLDRPGPLADSLPAGCVVSLGAKRGCRPWDRRAVAALRRFIEAAGIGVVHSHNMAAQQYAGLAVGRRCVHVHTEHGTNPHFEGLRNKLRLAWLRRTTDGWVAVSGHTADAIRAATGVTCHCVENGVDPTPSAMGREEARAQLGLPSGAVVVGVVGRLSSEKGVDRLLAAFAELPRPPEILLVVVGDGPLRPTLEQQIAHLDLDQRVSLCGARENARRLFRAFDLLVLPSRSEGLPMVLLEAMAERVPVLATPVGHCPQLLADGCGELLPAEASAWPSVLQETIERAVHGGLSGQVAAARDKVVSSYSLADTVARYEAIYREVLSC